MAFNRQASDVWKLRGWTWYRLFYLYTYLVKFKDLPCVMVQELLVCDDPRASYEVTNEKASVYEWRTQVAWRKLWMKQSSRRTIFRVLPLLTPWILAQLKCWLLWCCIHTWGLFHLRVYEMLVSIVAFYRDRSESNARRLSFPLHVHCCIQHINLQAFWRTTHLHVSIVILPLPQLAPGTS